MRNWQLIFLFFFGILSVSSFGQDDKCYRSTEGTDFWFGFMEGRNDNGNVHYIEITVTARQATDFKIYIGKDETPYYEGFVGDNTSRRIEIELERGEATGSETIQEKGIHLVAEHPVNVYALNWDRNSADVAVMYPVPSLGKQYYTMCYSPRVSNDPDHGRNSEFLIVATEDNTVVKITPSVNTDGGNVAGTTFIKILNKGEVYQVQSMNRQNLNGQGDLTGSYIESDKPVAVYSGNFATTIPAEDGMSGYDHLFEQMPPLHTWGREFYTVPLKTRRADRYRVMASADNTSITIGNNTPIIRDAGEFYEFILENNQPSKIRGDKPILVAQFSQSNRTDNNYTGGSGDPFMIVLSPISQTKNNVTFVAYSSSQIRDYYINIISLTSEIDNLELDGARIGTNLFTPFPGTDYSFTQIELYQGNHTLRNRDPEKGFLATVYGYGGYESYGYGIGFNLDLVLDLGYEEDTIPLCNGESVELDAGPFFDHYLWNIGDTTQKITVINNGWYKVVGSTVDGCSKSDSIYILVSSPAKPNIGDDRQGCSPYTVPLDAGTGYARYKWNTGETTQTIDANKTGVYSVTAFDKWGCYKSDTMILTVFPVPTISMIEGNLVCGTKSRTINLLFEGADQNMLENGTMIWSTNQPGKLTLSNKTIQSADILVTEFGDFEVTYVFTTPDGCKVSETLNLRFAETPTSKIEFTDNPGDKCGGYNRQIVYTGNATEDASYYWDFGGSYSEQIDWNLYSVSLGANNIKPLVQLVVEENGCWSDTTLLPIGANPDFVMNTTGSRGCDSATVIFSGELKTPDQLLFEWNFGDGSAISNVQNPTHFYADTGKYNVSLTITNELNGCKAGYTIDEMVKIYPTPKVDIVVDPDFCNDKTVEVFYQQYIDSSLCFWEFDGATQIGEGSGSVRVNLEKEIATIRLQVEEYGCISEWAQTTAKRKPIFNVSSEITDGCEPLQILAMATTTDETLDYLWLTDSLVLSGEQQTFLLPVAGNYDIQLAASSSLTGCSDTLLKKDFFKVHPKPTARFEVDYPVAILEHANLHFTNRTEDVDYFNWSFGDGNSSIEKHPDHTYTAIGKYNAELIVESEFGCTDTAAMEINIMPFNVYTPNAFRPDSDIPENREFMPVGEGVDPDGFLLQIYNRWGDLIFESNSPENKWNGTVKNNHPAPMGNYVWRADFNDIQGFKHSMKGQVLLIR